MAVAGIAEVERNLGETLTPAQSLEGGLQPHLVAIRVERRSGCGAEGPAEAENGDVYFARDIRQTQGLPQPRAQEALDALGRLPLAARRWARSPRRPPECAGRGQDVGEQPDDRLLDPERVAGLRAAELVEQRPLREVGARVAGTVRPS